MERRNDFKSAVAAFKQGRLEESLKLMSQALENGGNQQHIVYDSRAAVYEKMGKIREALMDAKDAIRLAPARWQSYTRAARLFLQIRRFDEARRMLDIALTKIPSDDQQNRATLASLGDEIREARRRFSCHLAALPVELLAELFQYLVDKDAVSILMICRVCRHWRNIALNTSSLWQTLVLTNKSPIRKCRTWIERSKGNILELQLRKTLLNVPDWKLNHLMGIQWDQLRVFHLEDLDFYPDEFLEATENLQLRPRLEELDVSDSGASPSRDILITRLGDTVQRLTLQKVCVTLPFQFASNSLVSLTLRDIPLHSMDAIYTVLENNPLLESLVLDTPLGAFLNPPPSKITLKHLHILESTGRTQMLFDYLNLPALRRVCVKQTITIDPVLKCLLESGSRSMEELSIASCTLSNTLMIDLLRANPLLESITLNYLASTSQAIIEALASSPLDAILCPALKNVDISHCPDVTTGPLMRLVKSRRLSVENGISDVQPIVTIKADGCPGIEASFLPWFRERVTFSCVYMTKKAASWKR
ncbi:f-box domain protein [Moniliophthora roreri MCA 2997]|uniref:F-box domain protein n=2 Tax=Moniliophthora roreri TaxID=221103 RepID=V2WU96_MONRO|nr:f-box domain protein [Moniliophthora roreri MCA 2997]KAI3616344.1 f-box domain protein [Moniliophthora roreri]